MKVTITVCEVCENRDKSTLTYEIREGGRKTKADLCAEHGKPVENLLADAAPRPRRQPRAGGRGGRTTSMEEIEAGKKANAI